MGEQQTSAWPWRDGNYRGEGFVEALVLTGSQAVAADTGLQMTFKHGVFGDVDEEIAEMTGEKNYTVEMSFEEMGKVIVSHGVLMEDGSKFVIRTFGMLLTLDWVTEEEAERLANDGDPISAPPTPYKVEPERQGRLVWITGPPALGKSTSAQLLSREHGYVYYEGDCFFGLKNPYIPPDVEGDLTGQMKQRKLVGEGAVERKAVVDRSNQQWEARLGGGQWDVDAMEAGYIQMFEDISRERARLGGDWAVACVLDSRRVRDRARCDNQTVSHANKMT